MDPLELMMTLQVRALGYQVFNEITASIEDLVAAGLTLDAVAPALSLIGVGIAAVTAAFGEAAIQAGQFATQTVEVANNANMTDAQLQQMRQDVLNVAQNTGQATDALATGYMHIADEGYKAGDATQILTAAAESAASTGANVADVANVLSLTLHDWGLNGQAAAATMDTLHVASALSNSTLTDFTSGMRNAAPVASVLGVSVDDTAAAVAVLTREGFTATQAGTQFRNFLTHLVAPTASATKAIQELSQVSGVDLVSDFTQAAVASKGLPAILQDIAAATGGNVTAFAALTGVTGVTADQMDLITQATNGNVAALQKMMPATRGLYSEFILTSTGAKDYVNILQQISAAHENGGVTAQNFARWEETLGAQISILQQNVHIAAIEIGNTFMPYVQRFVTFLTDSVIPAVVVLSDWIGNKFIDAVQAAGGAWEQLTNFFLGGNLLQNLENLGEQIVSFAASMFQAGVNIVEQLAIGMEQAASTILTEVVNEIANFIASFFVGMSPPPAGPLNKLPQGGQAAMASWVGGAQQGAMGITQVADQVSGALNDMGSSTNLGGLNYSLNSAKDNMYNLRDAVAGAKLQGAELQRQLDAINEQISTLNNQAKIITDDYNAQVQPLKDQLQTLQQTVDTAYELQNAQQNQVLAQDALTKLQLEGDPAQRAALQSQIEQLQNQQQMLSIESQIADIDNQKKQNAGDPAKLQSLDLRKQELSAQLALWNMTHNSQIDELNQKDAIIKANQEQAKAAEDVVKANRSEIEAGIKSQIDDATRAEQAKLAPIKQQLTDLQSQKIQLQDMLSQHKLNTAQLSNQASLAGDLAGRLGSAASAAKGLTSALPTGATLGTPINPNLNTDLKNSLETAMVGAVTQAQAASTTAIQGWMASIKSQIQGHISDVQDTITSLFDIKSGDVSSTLLNFANTVGDQISTWSTILSPYVNEFVQWLGPAISQTFSNLVSFVSPYISQFISWAGPFISNAFTTIVSFVTPYVQNAVNAISGAIGSAFTWLGQNASPLIESGLALLGTAVTTALGIIGQNAPGIITVVVQGLSAAISGIETALIPLVGDFETWLRDQFLQSVLGINLADWTSKGGSPDFGFGTAISVAIPVIQGILTNFWDQVRTWFDNGIVNAVSGIIKLPEQLAHPFEGIEAIVQMLGDALGGLKQLFIALEPGIKNLGIVLLAIGGAIAVVIDAILNFIGWLHQNQTAFHLFEVAVATAGIALAVLFAPITLVIAGIIALLAILTVAPTIFQALGTTAHNIITSIQNTFQSFVTFIGPLWRGVWDQQLNVLASFRDFTIAVIKLALDTIVGLGTLFGDLFSGNWTKAWEDTKSTALTLWNDIVDVIGNALLLVINIIGVELSVAHAIVGTVLGQVYDVFAQWIGNTVNGIQQFIVWVPAAWNGLWVDIKDAFINLWQAIYSTIGDHFNQLQALYWDTLMYIKDNWTATWTFVTTATQTAVTALLGVFATFFSNFETNLNTDIQGWLSTIEGFVSKFQSAGQDVINGLIQGLKDHANDVVNTLKDIVQAAIDAVKHMFGIHSPSAVFHEMGANVALGLANGMNAGSDAVANAATALMPNSLTPGISVAGAGSGGTTVEIIVSGNYILDDQTSSRLADIIGERIMDTLRTTSLTGRYQ